MKKIMKISTVVIALTVLMSVMAFGLSKDQFERMEVNPEIVWDLYKCPACGYVYDWEHGDPSNGVEEGTVFAAIPEDWVCPVCGCIHHHPVFMIKKNTDIKASVGNKANPAKCSQEK